MLLKLLQTSIKHGEKAQQVKEQYRDGFKSFVVEMRASMMKMIGDDHPFFRRFELYYPNLSPTDYHFFKHLDNFLSDKSFRTKEKVESAFKDFLASTSQNFYQCGINDLLDRWHRCMTVQGSYFD